MPLPRVDVFFYGSYMNPKVLREVGLVPGRVVPAKLEGFDILIAPRANLVRSPGARAFGVVADATHDELERLYAHARDVLGETYLPEAVTVEILAGERLAALCYLCHDMEPAPAENAYVERILAPAREHGFPDEYLKRLESFRPRETE